LQTDIIGKKFLHKQSNVCSISITQQPYYYNKFTSHEYQFRVIAENFYGKSEPCEPTAVIKTDESDAIKKKRAQEGKFIIVISVEVLGDDTELIFMTGCQTGNVMEGHSTIKWSKIKNKLITT
jgi:hypothetical protein